jgi:hypothetical protein
MNIEIQLTEEHMRAIASLSLMRQARSAIHRNNDYRGAIKLMEAAEYSWGQPLLIDSQIDSNYWSKGKAYSEEEVIKFISETLVGLEMIIRDEHGREFKYEDY